MSDCLLCKIRDGQIPAKKLLEDEHCFAIRDIQPGEGKLADFVRPRDL